MNEVRYRNERISEQVQLRRVFADADWSSYAWENTHRVVYGPVPSRRLGFSLGINLFPGKRVCSFQCTYCDVEPAAVQSTKRVDVDCSQTLAILTADLRADLVSDRRIDCIAFSGNGEPTMFPAFDRAARAVVDLRDKCRTGTPVVLFTNGAHLTKNIVSELFPVFDKIFLKLDGGSDSVVRLVNRPLSIPIPLQSYSGYRFGSNVCFSTMVLGGAHGNLNQLYEEEYYRCIRDNQVDCVYIYSLDYPCRSSQISAVPVHELILLAKHVSCNSGVNAVVLSRVANMPGGECIGDLF